MDIMPVKLDANKVILLDQRKLPWAEEYMTCSTPEDVAEAIKTMVVRGAPAIGIAAAMGIAIGMQSPVGPGEARDAWFEGLLDLMAATRPTAVNLFWAIDRMNELYGSLRDQPGNTVGAALLDEAQRILDEDIHGNRTLGRLGQGLLPDDAVVLTHCNAGALATGGYGTALGVIRAAKEAGKTISVVADETRPRLQGAHLTAWELVMDDIPVTLISDTAAGIMMASGEIDAVIVGADRIAANGDVANKVGTYMVALAAADNGIPFYVAAPWSTIDLAISSGDLIPIEERSRDEVMRPLDKQLTIDAVEVRNPAFDITPARYVSAIITERGVVTAPYPEGLVAIS